MTNLLEYTQFIDQKIYNDRQVNAVYTFLCKAFDKINNSILTFKLRYLFSFSESLVKLFESYLLESCLFVAYNSCD